MDNPSSVITQVSRDEEGSKAAGERGKVALDGFFFLYFFALMSKKVLQLREFTETVFTSHLYTKPCFTLAFNNTVRREAG